MHSTTQVYHQICIHFGLLNLTVVSTDWDAQRYADHIGLKRNGISDDHEAMMLRSFKPIKTDHLEIKPATITDRHEKLVVWYLPNILYPECRVNSVPYFIGLSINFV